MPSRKARVESGTMCTLENVQAQWQDVHRDTVALMSRVQYSKYLAYKAARKSRFAALVPEPGRITLPFDAGRHDGLSARLSAVVASLDMVCRELDEKNTYKQHAAEVTRLRVKMADTQHLLDRWFCDGQK